MSDLSRIDEIRKVMTGEREMPPSGKTLVLEMVRVEEGSTTIRMPIDERFLNRGRGVQGGFLAALADAAMGTSLATVTDEGESHSTVEFKLNFFRPAVEGTGPLSATGRVLHRGRRIGHVEGEIRGAGGELIAKATSTWAIRKSDGSAQPERE